LIQRAIDRHGGWALWARLESVTLGLRELRGLLPAIKGYGRTFELPRSLTAFPRRQRVEFNQQGHRNCAGVFERGTVSLLDPVSGRVLAESAEHRRTFRGLRRLRRWSALDAFYFFGYAFASYTAMPFVLPDLPFRRLVVGSWCGERLQGVEIEYPAGAHVHSRRQRYFFDEGGLLRRNDYVAEVVGWWATGAHGWDDYANVDGLAVPTRRTVVFRAGRRPVRFLPVLSATFEDLSVRLSAPDE
jgi:hypothetical protein